MFEISALPWYPEYLVGERLLKRLGLQAFSAQSNGSGDHIRPIAAIGSLQNRRLLYVAIPVIQVAPRQSYNRSLAQSTDRLLNHVFR